MQPSLSEHSSDLLPPPSLTGGFRSRQMLVPTELDYSDKEDEKVKKKLQYIYSYGITMFQRGLIEGDAVPAPRSNAHLPAFDAACSLAPPARPSH